jgi:hypothetical protein
MTGTVFGLITGIVTGLLTMMAILAGGLRWVYRQGSSASEQVQATKQNTRATDELSGTLRAFIDRTDGMLVTLIERVARLEAWQDKR